jgi:cyclin B
MFIAAKYEEMYAPEIGDFVYITDRAYTESQIREMEMKILSSLEFNLGRPLPLNFLRRNSKAGNVDALVHTLAKYVMELTLVNYEFTHWEPSKLAAAALALSLKVLDRDEKSIQELWTPTLVYYTAYPIEKLRKMVTELASWVWDTTKQPADAKLMAVRKKYEDKKLSKIAGLSDLTGPIMAELKNGAF